MPRKCYRAEEIIHKLREAEVAFAKGKSTAEVCKKLGVAEQRQLPLAVSMRRLEGRSG
jgi:hypothetical protein